MPVLGADGRVTARCLCESRSVGLSCHCEVHHPGWLWGKGKRENQATGSKPLNSPKTSHSPPDDLHGRRPRVVLALSVKSDVWVIRWRSAAQGCVNSRDRARGFWSDRERLEPSPVRLPAPESSMGPSPRPRDPVQAPLPGPGGTSSPPRRCSRSRSSARVEGRDHVGGLLVRLAAVGLDLARPRRAGIGEIFSQSR